MEIEPQIRHGIEIDRAPEDVWEWLEDPVKQQRWMKGLVFNELTSEPPAREGSTFRMGIQEGRKVAEYTGTITRYDRPRRLVLRMTGGCMKEGALFVEYTLTDLKGRTRVEYAGGAEMRGLWKVFGFLFRVFGTFQIKSFFRQLKEHVEAAPPAKVTA